MYGAKELIGRMKKVAKLESNLDLAKYLNISYNTLNTWLKRGKIPQEVILEFAEKNSCSLDYLIFNKENSVPKTADREIPKTVEAPYFGEYEPLNIGLNSVIKLDTEKIFSGGHYLFKKDNIAFIAKASINPFNKTALLENSLFSKEITLDEFYSIKKGLIVSVINK